MSKSKNRMAANTLMLYTRQIVILLVNMYTIRIVLSDLGETDYGIYTVVGSITSMFTMFSGAMASASQRFFSYDMGKQDDAHLKKTFSMMLIIYMALVIASVILMESFGLWYVLKMLNVPEYRKTATFWTYQMSVLGLSFNLITVPYMALIIAHEEMKIYAALSIIEAAFKLVTAAALQIIKFDKLIIYAVLTVISVMSVTLMYRYFCRRKYMESKFSFFWDKIMFKEIAEFTGWNMFGSAVGTSKIQLVNVVLNQYFSAALVTARGIATSVNTAVTSFSQSLNTAMRPIIIKEYAAEDYKAVDRLIESGAKLTFFLMYIFILPVCLEMEYVIGLWLGYVPDGAVIFTILTLLDALIDSVSFPLMTAAQATGRIRLYQSVVGMIQIANFPFALIAVVLGMPAFGIFVIAIVLTVVALGARLFILEKIMDFSGERFARKVVFPLMLVCLVTFCPPYMVTRLMQPSFLRVVVTTFVSLACTGIVFYIFAMNEPEKRVLWRYLRKKVGCNGK